MSLEELQVKTNELAEEIEKLKDRLKDTAASDALSEKVNNLETEIKSLQPKIDFGELNQHIKGKIDELGRKISWLKGLELFNLGLIALLSFAAGIVLNWNEKSFAVQSNQKDIGFLLSVLAGTFTLLYLGFPIGIRKRAAHLLDMQNLLEILRCDTAVSAITVDKAKERYQEIIKSIK